LLLVIMVLNYSEESLLSSRNSSLHLEVHIL
jgi:hypothetical protein